MSLTTVNRSEERGGGKGGVLEEGDWGSEGKGKGGTMREREKWERRKGVR